MTFERWNRLKHILLKKQNKQNTSRVEGLLTLTNKQPPSK